MFRVTRAYDSELFGIKKRFSIVIAHAVRRLHDIQCTYIYGTCDVDRHTLHTPYRAVNVVRLARGMPCMHVERACSCTSFLSYWQFVPDRKVNCFRSVSKNQLLMQKYIFYFLFFPPLAYDSGTPCDEKHRNKNVWPYTVIRIFA